MADGKQQQTFFQNQPARSLADNKLVGNGINGLDAQGRTLLYWAVLAKNESLVETLLEAGADPNLRMSNRTVLHEAAQYGTTPKILRTLVEAGADLEVGNDYKVTPFNMLAPGTSPEMIRLWVELGASIMPGKNKYSLLHSWANSEGTTDGLQTLLDLGLPIDAPDRDFGLSPLGYAIYNNDDLAIIDFFFDRGANLHGREKHGQPIFFVLAKEYPDIRGSQERHVKKMNHLLRLGLDLSITDFQGRTFLMEAFEWAHTTALVETVLHHGSKTSAKDLAGRTPLDYLESNHNLLQQDKQRLQNLLLDSQFR